MNQYENFACVIFNNNPKHPVDFTHVYLPTMEFATFEQRGNWLFAEAHNGGYVGVYCSTKLQRLLYGPNKDREFIAQGRKAVYLLRVGSKHGYGSFESFMKAMQNTPMAATAETYVFEYAALGRLVGGWDVSLQVQGRPVRYNGFDPVGTNLWYNER